METTNWDNLVSGDEIKKVFRKRKVGYDESTIWETSLPEYEAEGWYKSAYTKTKNRATGARKVRVRKNKKISVQFENDVWTMFYKMGFDTMNRDDNFTIHYDSSNSSFSQQIDVFAADEDTVLVVECKTAEKRKGMTFKKDIEALGGNMQKIRNEIFTCPEFRGKKIKFIWATKNIILDGNDIERLKGYGISYFDDDSIRYYTQLSDHLGHAARYQLLGDIFKGIEIKSMDMRVPAIAGKMGGFTYYEFSIEPAKLLKIGYVLHHSMAISSEMVTYQRIIKKSRLQQIRKFINAGGYFPNSIIISVDAKSGSLQFDQVKPNLNSKLYKMGILHLPNKYHSAYIIDGQHRLYGYSDTEYANKNAIPVVAFVNLDPHKQMELFMDINENQKAVPKTLRVVLNGELLWTSQNKNDQREALRSRLAQQLGMDKNSPLYQRIKLTEDVQDSEQMCLTVAAIQSALKLSNFFSTYDSAGNSITHQGSFDKDDLQSTYNLFFPFIRNMLTFIADKCKNEWDKGKSGILAHNRGVQGCIRVISDIVDFLCSDGSINPLNGNINDTYNGVKLYLEGLVDYINGASDEEKNQFIKLAGAGAGADKRYWRRFQLEVNKHHPEFKPAGLSDYLLNETQQFNAKARIYIDEIERKAKDIAKDKLKSAYGDQWFAKGLPKNIAVRAQSSAYSRNLDIDAGKVSGAKVEPWDFITLADLSKIVVNGSNWSSLFENVFVRPEEQGKLGDKNIKTDWMIRADAVRHNMNGTAGSSYSVKKTDFDELESVYKWLYSKKK